MGFRNPLDQAAPIIAVAQAEHIEFGCPHCGYRSGSMPVSVGGAAAWICGECGITCCVLADGVTKSGMGFGDVYPDLQNHPRRGTPSHGQTDKQPETGGEFFYARGIGSDFTPGCFVCGGDPGLYANIAGFVQCCASGERVAAMFETGARIDYRIREPDRVQVKIGACETHVPNLKNLTLATYETKTITIEMIEAAMEKSG